VNISSGEIVEQGNLDILRRGHIIDSSQFTLNNYSRYSEYKTIAAKQATTGAPNNRKNAPYGHFLVQGSNQRQDLNQVTDVYDASFPDDKYNVSSIPLKPTTNVAKN
jgi:hypothetical protein